MSDFQSHLTARCHRQRLGNYQLIEWLGRGGFAEVYLGEHIYLGTRAAVKVLHTDFTNIDINAFFDEARIAAHLVHPHIVRVLEFGLEEGMPFLVMDYAANGTLRQSYPPGSQLTPKVMLEYIEQVTDALQYIHDKGYIHRDIKPENLLQGPRNEILLSDFGIAIAVHKAITDEQVRTGTITYMAPELLQPQGYPNRASDQYALAIMIYEWLYGAPPFRGTVNEILFQHLLVLPPSICAKVPLVPQAAEDVIFKALAKDFRQRFESVCAFTDALRHAFEPQTVTLRNYGPLEQTLPVGLSVSDQDLVMIKPEPVQSKSTANMSQSIWRETAACFAASLLIGIALTCVLYWFAVVPLQIELFVSLHLILFPCISALINRKRFLFILNFSIALVAIVPALIFQFLPIFIVLSVVMQFLSLLTALAVSINEM